MQASQEEQMELIDHPLSPYAMKVRACLYEKGLEFSRHEIWTESQREELRAANPRLEVPALRDGDVTVYDSKVIVAYLEDKDPSTPLLSADPAGRARARAHELVADTQLDPCIIALALFKFFRPGLATTAAASLRQAEQILATLYSRLDEALQGRPHLLGEFSLADIAYFPHVSLAAFIGYGPGDDRPNLTAWFARMNERPSLQRTSQDAMSAFERSQTEENPFFDNDRLQWRSERLEMLVRIGLGEWLLGEMAQGHAFLPQIT
jgi:RNA polymerase-associated protein